MQIKIRKVQSVISKQKGKHMNKRRLPSEGTIDTIYERLKEYIVPVNPDWEKQIKPSRKMDIKRIYEISRIEETGYTFPDAYLEYLKYMGEDDGGFLSYGIHANTDLTTIFMDYNGKGEDIDDPIEPNHYVFAYNMDVGSEFCITTKENGRQIITSGNEENYGVEYYSESFEKLLFQVAYNVYERKYFQYGYYFGTNRITYQKMLNKLGIDDMLPLAEETMKKYGFEKTWFSDTYHLIAEKEGITFGIWRDLTIYGYVLGNDEEQVEKYGGILNDLLGTNKQ